MRQPKPRHDLAQKCAAPLARIDEQHLPRTQDRNDQPRQSRPAPQVDPKPLALTRIERKQLRAVGDMPHPNCRNRRHGDQILPLVLSDQQGPKSLEALPLFGCRREGFCDPVRSEEQTSELQSIMRLSYSAVGLTK